MIIGGVIQKKVVRYIKEILQKHELQYTAHGCYGLDLRNLKEHQIQRSVLFSSITVCKMLDIGLLNLHYNEESRFADQEQMFLKIHLEAADYAAEQEIILAMENVEVEHTDKTLLFLKQANHPNLRMTLDLGHLYLSARYFGYDYIKTVTACAPWLGHLHINDNTGVFENLRLENYLLYNTMSMGYRFAFGRGDIHVPPFWGKVPLKAALSIIKHSGYQGIWLCEYYSQFFHPYNREIQEYLREVIIKL